MVCWTCKIHFYKYVVYTTVDSLNYNFLFMQCNENSEKKTLIYATLYGTQYTFLIKVCSEIMCCICIYHEQNLHDITFIAKNFQLICTVLCKRSAYRRLKRKCSACFRQKCNFNQKYYINNEIFNISASALLFSIFITCDMNVINKGTHKW